MLIAEIGSVHDGSFGNAVKLIELASECGADAVKFQTHIAEAETLVNAPAPAYFNTESRTDYFNRTSFSRSQWAKLSECASQNNVKFISSPFSLEAVDLLESIDMEIYKIPSGEVSNLPLLEKISRLGKPVFLSSGMSSWDEMDQAVDIFKSVPRLVVMQCSSEYPCAPENVGLNVIEEIKERYHCEAGFSDHTLGIAAPLAAAVLGATVIEKHFTFSKKMYGSDAKHSMEPEEFKVLASSLREIRLMLSNPVNKARVDIYKNMKAIFEKSIVASKSLKAGKVVEESDFSFKKPGDGIRADKYKNLLGRKLVRSVEKDHKFSEEDFE